MRKFISKIIFFTSPFAILYIVTLAFYSNSEEPDLLRLGYIPNVHPNYRNAFNLESEEKFEKLSSSKKRKFKLMTIGDSFSEQGGFGYQNMLADEFSVLHVDRFISKNQNQTLINMINGGFFDKYQIEYVVLQNVERNIMNNMMNIDYSKKITRNEIDSIIKNSPPPVTNYTYNLFSSSTITFPLFYLPRFYLDKNYLSNDNVYNCELNSKLLFSNHSSKLLFYHNDISSIKKNNSKENVNTVNNVLNEISSKLNKLNIKLIVLPSPDKFDFYYSYLVEQKQFTKPMFFELMKKTTKNYIYIDSKELLSSKINSIQDIYFYDDTHWSPNASKIISKKIKDLIK